jgi:hypothetical protein
MNTISIPVPNYVKNGNTLTEWLGYFWTRTYENPDFSRSVQQGQGLMAAQLYLNYLESLNIRDRNGVPVFHRERWKPVILRRSQAGTGSASLLRIGMDPTPVIGPQVSPEFMPNTTFTIGGTAAYLDVISYPITGITDIATCLADNIALPATVLVRDTDFIIRENTLFFLRVRDPFTLDFPKRIFLNENGEQDEEIILWAADAMIDLDYIYNYIGYVMGVLADSSEYYRTLLNALWDTYNDGTPMGLLYSAIGAILGEPTIIHATETVERIIEEPDVRLVVTDRHVYRTVPAAPLRDSVVPGAVLNSGEFLTQTVRVYETLDPMKLAAVSEYGARLRTDVSSMFFDRRLFRAPLQFGIGADWELSDITRVGLDANGNPKLQFQLYGDPDDIRVFWETFWDYCEQHNLSSETCFSGYIDDIVSPVDGAVYGRVAPMEFFMRYFLKTNMFIIVVDRVNLAVTSLDRNPIGLLTLLRDVIPAHVLMIVVEQRIVGGEDYDLSTAGEDMTKTLARVTSDWATYGMPSSKHLTYKDRQPVIRWIPTCQ